ncbi:MAG: hypothetical protein SFV15_10140 [Polyangiaceae bacterium]|nr:hypothetical protein [Polyangiaceae bacterium]
MALGGSLPEIYSALLSEDLANLELKESRADCSHCSMCHGPQDPYVAPFLPSTKCCTYWPKLPNYLVGSLLSDTSGRFTEGQRRVRAKIAEGVECTPLGLGPTAEWMDRFHAIRTTAFGRDETLLCPYYDSSIDGGGCSIWAHRESDCTSFFCKFENARHYEFWRQLGAFLALMEQKLAPWAQSIAAREGDFTAAPEAFFIRTSQAVRGLVPHELPAILGEPWERRSRELERAMADLVPFSVPERVRLARGLRVLKDEQSVSLVSYNELDAIQIPLESYLFLENAGRSVSTVSLVEQLANAQKKCTKPVSATINENLNEQSLVQWLLDHEVLSSE